MPPRKKAKTTNVVEPDNTPLAMVDPALHPDLAAQSTPIKMDPAVLHPDLAAASATLDPIPQPPEFSVDASIAPRPPPKQPRQRKNASAAARAAAAAAQLQQQNAPKQEEASQVQIPLAEPEPEVPAVSVDAAAEFLRTIQEREAQKALPLQVQQEVLGDNGIPTELAQLYQIPQPQPSYQGFPSPQQFNDMVEEYLGSLSPKKQAKALLTQQMYDDILNVLLHPTETKVGSAQFRFWAKKMFQLVTTQVAHIVVHEEKPVAVKEQLYDVLVQCHSQANHGGRDKTAAQVNFPNTNLY